MRFVWQISAGQLFESLRPVAFALAALASTWVLCDARRRRFNAYAITSWTLGTLFFSLITLPIYLVVSFTQRRSASRASVHSFNNNANSSPAPLRFKWTLPMLYALLVLSIGALFFYHDARSVDAHLARANQARLMNQRARTIREYEAALRLEDDAHTHNLLAVELAADSHWEEALTNFRAAERGNEPDDELHLHIANALDALKRSDEATLEYQKFLNTSRCAQSNPFPQCGTARARIQATQTNNKP